MQDVQKTSSSPTLQSVPGPVVMESVRKQISAQKIGSAQELDKPSAFVKWLIAPFVGIGNFIAKNSLGVFSFTTTSITILVLLIFHLRSHLSTRGLIILALWEATSALLVETSVKWRKAKTKYKRVRLLADKLLFLKKAAPPQLEDYLDTSVARKIQALTDLSEGRSSDCTYPEQIEIAYTLANDENTSRFWATTNEPPSVLWTEAHYYFDLLERLLGHLEVPRTNDPPGKARLVILTFDALYEDYTANNEKFNAFVEWHTRTGFGLRFYLIPNNDDLTQRLNCTD